MKEGRKPECPEKTLDNEFQSYSSYITEAHHFG